MLSLGSFQASVAEFLILRGVDDCRSLLDDLPASVAVVARLAPGVVAIGSFLSLVSEVGPALNSLALLVKKSCANIGVLIFAAA